MIILGKQRGGFGLVEIIVSIGLWAILAMVSSTFLLGSFRTTTLSNEVATANGIAQEGLDALKAIKKQGWTSPFLGTSCVSGCGLATVSGTWAYSGVSNVIGKFTRQVFVTPVNRDGGGNIVTSGGTVDSDTYLARSTVSWSPGGLRSAVVSAYTYLSNYVKAIVTSSALLVYGDGTTVPKTRTYDKSSDTFGAQALSATGSSGVTFRMRASPTKTEAIAGYVTAAGVLQIMCFDGSSWSNDFSVTVGGNGSTRRFDIAYETASGEVVVLYSTNTATTNELAYRTKSGGVGCGTANWSAATNLDPVRTSGIVQWVKMAWDRRSGQNLITAIWADSNSDLSAMVWSGSAWGNEPASALATTLQVVGAAQDVEDFAVEYESLSGDVLIVWGITVAANTNGVRYATCTGGTSACTWSGVLTPATFTDDATNLDLSANLDTNEMVFASIGLNQSDLQIGYWSGTAWTNTANADTSCNTPVAGSKLVASGWLTVGGVYRSIVRYADQGSSAIDWYVGNAGTFTKQTDFTVSPAPSTPIYYDVQVDPVGKSQLMAMVSASGSLYAKRLVMTAGPTFTWTNSDGAVLTSTLPQNINSPYSFIYWRQ